jgi:hypothetical protein
MVGRTTAACGRLGGDDVLVLGSMEEKLEFDVTFRNKYEHVQY